MCNTYGFPTVTVVTRTRLSVTLYVHWLSCCKYEYSKTSLSVLVLKYLYHDCNTAPRHVISESRVTSARDSSRNCVSTAFRGQRNDLIWPKIAIRPTVVTTYNYRLELPSYLPWTKSKTLRLRSGTTLRSLTLLRPTRYTVSSLG
jgi:hypothetical protein